MQVYKSRVFKHHEVGRRFGKKIIYFIYWVKEMSHSLLQVSLLLQALWCLLLCPLWVRFHILFCSLCYCSLYII